MSALQRWLSGLSGRRIGTDSAGNVYFEGRREDPHYGRSRRWVIFAGTAEATVVPPEWHGWLHYTLDEPLQDAKRLPWMKPHLPNLTGTPQAYRSATQAVAPSRREPAGAYEAWTPGG